MNEEIKREIKGRLVSFIDGKFFLTFTVLTVATILLVKDYINATAYATIITGGIFAYDITSNESYSEIIKDKIENKIREG